jgi:UPF0042 nucleotide-binding protein
MPATDPAGRPRLLLITGLSGSGKSAAAKALEDIGYFCVDNLPLPLLRRFVFDTFEFVRGENRIAVVTDVRAPGFATEFPRMVREIDRHDVDPTLVFLEASDEALVRRFTESRRPHPLAANRPLQDGILEEREALAELRDAADLVFDTTEWSVHQLRDAFYSRFGGDSETTNELVVSIVSFGFKFGIPYGTDTLFDVRFLPNPYFVDELREKTGLDAEVRAFLDDQPEFHDLAGRIAELMLYLLPRYKRENRRYFSVAIGCTGGKHRSVATAERLAKTLEEKGWGMRVIHRDIQRPS